MSCPACAADTAPGASQCTACGAALSPPASLRPGAVIASRYELLTLVGRGGMGIVFKANDRMLGETVAVKFLDVGIAASPILAQRFRDEIRLARKVTHRGVCRIHEYGEDAGLSYISMAYVDGVDLKRLIGDQGPLPAGEAIEVGIAVAEALQAIHEEGILHRDLKTSNIMKDSRGLVRLMDFGLAKEWMAEGPGATATGQLVGTPDYMSPEQAEGRKADQRSDIYALGIVLFELLTGTLPFPAETPVAALVKRIQDEAPLDGPAAAAIPRAVLPLLRKALARDPQQRFASAADLAAALRYVRIAGDSIGEGRLEQLPRAATVYEWTDAAGEAAPWKAARRLPEPPRRGRALVWLTALFGAVSVLSLATAWSVYDAARPRDAEPERREPGPSSPAPMVATPEPAGSSAPPASPSPGERPEANPAPRASPSPEPGPAVLASVVPTTAPPSPAPGVAAAEEPTPATGSLRLLVVPAAEVLVDGRSLGEVSTRDLALTMGVHVVRILHPDYQPLQRVVTIRAGEKSRLVVDLAEKAIPRR